MKRLHVLLSVCLAATALTGLAFLNNIVAIVHWWQAFLAAGGDTAAMESAPGGFLPWLDWTAVDYSSVTTLIPALGLFCMTRSLWLMRCGRRMRAEDFPFFKGSDQLNVALGLFGTLWGIIVIGYFKLDTVSMADLMQCLHTALFSTLMAVVWVFMIDRPLVRPYFARLLESTGLAETDEGDLAEAVERLVVRLGAASDAFDRRQTAFEKAFETRQTGYEKAYETRQANFERAFETRLSGYEKAYEARLAKFDEAFKRRMGELDTFCQGRLAAYEKEFEARQKEYVETFRRRIEELKAGAEEARVRAERAEARADEVNAKLNAVTAALR